MKKVLLATVSVLALETAALAAPPTPMTWTGFYVGAQGGFAASRGTFTPLGPNIPVNLVLGQGFSANDTGAVLGLLGGYNYQMGNYVFGVEGDWNWVGAKASSAISAAGFTTTTAFDVRWLATVRGRLGFTTGATLFYVTGGVAFADVNNSSFSLIPGGTNTDIVDNTTRVGWTVGGGIEYMFAPHWTARVEGRYIDLGKSSFTYVNTAGTYRGEFRNSLVTGLLGLAYKF